MEWPNTVQRYKLLAEAVAEAVSGMSRKRGGEKLAGENSAKKSRQDQKMDHGAYPRLNKNGAGPVRGMGGGRG
jgi:hypothetical protein